MLIQLDPGVQIAVPEAPGGAGQVLQRLTRPPHQRRTGDDRQQQDDGTGH